MELEAEVVVPKSAIAELIDNALVANAQEKKDSIYIGSASLGTDCDRELWYNYHQPIHEVNAKSERIFKMGHFIEEMILNMLKMAGLTVWDKGADGKQFGFISDYVKGKIDAIAKLENGIHLIEIKGVKNTSFNRIVKVGIQAFSRKYYIQVQTYMLKMNVENCLFVVMNKDNCEMYYEYIKLDRDVANNAIMKGNEIAVEQVIPDRKFAKSDFFKCKICKYQKRCWEL